MHFLALFDGWVAPCRHPLGGPQAPLCAGCQRQRVLRRAATGIRYVFIRAAGVPRRLAGVASRRKRALLSGEYQPRVAALVLNAFRGEHRQLLVVRR